MVSSAGVLCCLIFGVLGLWFLGTGVSCSLFGGFGSRGLVSLWRGQKENGGEVISTDYYPPPKQGAHRDRDGQTLSQFSPNPTAWTESQPKNPFGSPHYAFVLTVTVSHSTEIKVNARTVSPALGMDLKHLLIINSMQAHKQ